MYKLLFTGILFIIPAYAQDDLYESLNHSNYEPSFFSLLFGLIVVIALVYLTGIVYKKLTKIKLDDSSNDKNKIEIVSAVSLGQGKNVYIIKANSSYSLIGATQNNISYLKDLGECNEN